MDLGRFSANILKNPQKWTLVISDFALLKILIKFQISYVFLQWGRRKIDQINKKQKNSSRDGFTSRKQCLHPPHQNSEVLLSGQLHHARQFVHTRLPHTGQLHGEHVCDVACTPVDVGDLLSPAIRLETHFCIRFSEIFQKFLGMMWKYFTCFYSKLFDFFLLKENSLYNFSNLFSVTLWN